MGGGQDVLEITIFVKISNGNITNTLLFLLLKYEGRSESSNYCLIIQLIFIVIQKETHLI